MNMKFINSHGFGEADFRPNMDPNTFLMDGVKLCHIDPKTKEPCFNLIRTSKPHKFAF